jgi:hypothetical protein
MRNRLVLVAVAVLLTAACGSDTAEPTISFDEGGCSSSDPSSWPSGALEIAISNGADGQAAVVLGTYSEGFGREDLVAYGNDVSIRPEFINALEIYPVAPHSSGNLAFDPGPGTYFMVCMPDTNSMVVLDDLNIDG